MVYRGTIRQGRVVLDETPALPDGTRVQVQLLEESGGAGTHHFQPVGSWEGPPGELDRLLADVQQLRDADLTVEDRREDETLSP